jgi:hypothetical protein
LKTRIQKLVLRKGRQQWVNQFLSVVKQCSVSVCTTTSLAVFLMFQSESSETGNLKILLHIFWKISKTNDTRYVLQERTTFQKRLFDFNHDNTNI